jgi:cardiolipin synthase A/B
VTFWDLAFRISPQWYWMVPLILAYIGVILMILLENKNPTKSIAYIMLLALVPVLGLVVYYFFGRDYRKQKLFSIKGAVDGPVIESFWTDNNRELEKRVEQTEKKFGDLIVPARLIFNQHQGFLTLNNSIKLLLNGEAKFPEVLKSLEQAQHHIHMEYYIFCYDDVGKKIVDILIRKVKEGVEVRLIIDDFGSTKNKKMVRRLRKAGVPVHRFMPVAFPFFAQANFRNHRKIIVVDGRIGFEGGINIDERYLNNGKHKLFWRDTHIKIEGPLVNQLQMQFLLSWHFTSKKKFPFERPYFGNQFDIQGRATATLVASGPDSTRPHCMEAILAAITQAREKIWIVTPYFIPTDQIITALQMAVSNGIEVKMILPGKSDSHIVKHASLSYIAPLLKSGIKIYFYNKGFAHAKTMTFDNQLAIIGTANMDTRSFYINFEIAALIYDEKLCGEVDESFINDLNDSEEIMLARWSKRSLYNRLLDSLCRLLAPLL